MSRGTEVIEGTLRAVGGLTALGRAVLRPERPDRLLRGLIAGARWGPTVSGLVALGAARHPDATAIVDDDGSLTYDELWTRTDRIAAGLAHAGIGQGTTVGILARNGRTFVEALIGAAKLGSDIVYLNTGFAAPQLADVVEHEGIDVVLHDADFDEVVQAAGTRAIGADELERMTYETRPTPSPVRVPGRTVILTSGTTGRPKGAQREGSSDPSAVVGLLEAVPIRARDTVMIAPPLFHAWGLSHLALSLSLSSTVVLRRSADPETVLDAVDRHDADGLVVVPIMLARMLALDPATLDRLDTSSLRYIASSGSALGASLATDVLEAFGPVLYNIYGSTEVSLAAIAGPDELTAAPATAGRPPLGATVKLLDDEGREVADGEVGRIFVGSASRFDGYTGGGTKETIDGMMSTGDVGRFVDGLLFVEGRDDDMIISGGENVYPAEVEDLLASHPDVTEAAVIGVDDDEFGQRLLAFVVLGDGAEADAESLRDLVRSNLARHKVPREVRIVDDLPRTLTGKLLRRKLTDS